MQRANVPPEMMLKALEIVHLRDMWDDHDIQWLVLRLGDDTQFILRSIKFAMDELARLAPRNSKGAVERRNTISFALEGMLAGCYAVSDPPVVFARLKPS